MQFADILMVAAQCAAPAPPVTWLLTGGTWADAGGWVDSATWED